MFFCNIAGGEKLDRIDSFRPLRPPRFASLSPIVSIHVVPNNEHQSNTETISRRAFSLGVLRANTRTQKNEDVVRQTENMEEKENANIHLSTGPRTRERKRERGEKSAECIEIILFLM